MSDWLTAIEARETNFGRPPMGRRGYHEDEVDDFVEQIVARLDGRGRLTAIEARETSFGRPPMGRRGYHDDEVDAFLRRAEAAIAQLDRRA